MEPMDINGGRCYVRPLHDDNRIDDRPALSLIHNHPIPEDYVEKRRQEWASESTYSWAACEQTSVEMLALITLTPQGDGTARIEALPAGDPERQLPNDPVLEQKTVGDAVAEGRDTVQRWAESYLGLKVI